MTILGKSDVLKGNKKIAQTVKVLNQTPHTRKDILRDIGRKSLLPGKRISKNGNIYWETRENRSDKANKNI